MRSSSAAANAQRERVRPAPDALERPGRAVERRGTLRVGLRVGAGEHAPPARFEEDECAGLVGVAELHRGEPHAEIRLALERGEHAGVARARGGDLEDPVARIVADRRQRRFDDVVVHGVPRARRVQVPGAQRDGQSERPASAALVQLRRRRFVERHARPAEREANLVRRYAQLAGLDRQVAASR